MAVVILQDRRGRGRECKTGSILIAQELTDDFPLYNSFFVEDVAASLDFFTRAFGLKTEFLHDGGDYGELATGGTKLAFSSRALMRQLAKSPALRMRQGRSSKLLSKRTACPAHWTGRSLPELG